MFIGQFFKGNLNFEVLETLKAISKPQLYLENNILREYNNYTIYMHFSIRCSFLKVHLGPWDKL